MPVYDFQCHDCQATFEKICSWSRTESHSCPECGSIQTEIQFPTPAIVRCGTLFNRRKIPTDFKEGVLEPIKKHYTKRGYASDAIKI